MKATIKTESKNRALKKKILLHITLLKLEKTNPSAVSVLQLLSLKTEKICILLLLLSSPLNDYYILP